MPLFSFSLFSPAFLCVRHAPACLGLGLALFFALPAQAQEPAPSLAAEVASAWVVSDLSLESTAANAALARERVFDAAPQAALARLWGRLLPAASRAQVPAVSDDTLAEWIADLRIQRERYSAVRYAATFSLRFRPDPVRAFLDAQGLPYAETISRPLLVLPLFTLNGRNPRLFDAAANPWLSWWHARPAENGLVPVVIPLGDLEDLARITPAAALRGDARALFAIASRYRSRRIVVAHADLRVSDLRGSRLLLEVREYALGAPPRRSARVLTPEGNGGVRAPGEAIGDSDLTALFARAAESFLVPIQDDWRARHLIRSGVPRAVVARMWLRSARDWGRLRRALGRLPGRLSAEVIGFVGREVRVVVRGHGNQGNLRDSLLAAGLLLEPLPSDSLASERAIGADEVLEYDLGDAASEPTHSLAFLEDAVLE